MFITKVGYISLSCLILFVSMTYSQEIVPDETTEVTDPQVATGDDTDAPYNLTMRQLASKTGTGVNMGTELDYTVLNAVGSNAHSLLYGTIAAQEYNMVLATSACDMYTIASSFNISDWDYTRCKAMIQYAQDNELTFTASSLVYGGPMEKHPQWIRDEKNATKLEKFMLDYIANTVGTLDVMTVDWVVVDEAIYDGDGRTYNNNPWSMVDDYVCKAFTAAKQAGNSAQLFLNDYGIGENTGYQQTKAYKAFQIVADLQKRNCGIDGIGFETHVDLSITNDNYSAIRQNLNKYGALNPPIRVMFSGVDVRCNRFGNPAICNLSNPWPDDSLKLQGRIYSRLLNICLYATNCHSFITKGFSDFTQKYEDIQNPLPFDKDFKRKEAYYELCFLLEYYTPPTPPQFSQENELNE